MRQTIALAVKEKHQIQLIHSRTEPRPPGMALRIRSNTAAGPRSFVIKWLSRNVASDPKTKMNQIKFPSDMSLQNRVRRRNCVGRRRIAECGMRNAQSGGR